MRKHLACHCGGADRHRHAAAILSGAGGALIKMDGVSSGSGGTLVYFSCVDCADEAARVAKAGGKLEREKFSIGHYGFIALAVDTEGNMIGLHSQK